MAQNGTGPPAIRRTPKVLRRVIPIKGLCCFFVSSPTLLLLLLRDHGRGGGQAKRGNGEGKAAHGQRGMAAVRRIAAGEGQQKLDGSGRGLVRIWWRGQVL